MMKKWMFFFLVLIACGAAEAQDMTKFKLYHPEANAKKDIESVVKQAKESGRHVLIQVGGNWCVWCARFEDFVKSDPALDSLVKANYVVYHLNHSKENKNNELLAKYAYPQRFGFPVFLVLDGKGELLHTQTSWYLESGKSYDKEKVTAFFNDWSRKAIDPAQYKEEK